MKLLKYRNDIYNLDNLESIYIIPYNRLGHWEAERFSYVVLKISGNENFIFYEIEGIEKCEDFLKNYQNFY